MKKVKEITKKATENYYKPTPKKWRKIGDSIMDLSIIISSITAFTTSPIVPVISIIVGRIGKIITNFYSE